MKECSGKSDSEWSTWLTQPKNWPGGQQDQGHEVVLHVQEEVYQLTITFRRRIAGDQKFWFVRLTHPSSVLTQTKSSTKYQSLGLTLLNARSSCVLFLDALYIWEGRKCVRKLGQWRARGEPGHLMWIVFLRPRLVSEVARGNEVMITFVWCAARERERAEPSSYQ